MGLEDAVRGMACSVVIASIGPTTSETLAELGLPADFEPSHPKMGLLVNRDRAAGPEILQSKQ